ncbi:hypothetical protein OG337_07440 [[Kitasatospora] papulosa]|uniref:hypothetical protein n=1 Tax=Streptomyces TaxID=1883 RepID=UPI000AB3A996|nr:hypothetical protein [Streptomyces flavovirens]WSZ47160.1 hypothetical protein OG337_07440 [[Kitasatospora] papulosa]
MTHDTVSSRTALDLLDAHLEDLWDGADLPLLPDGLDGQAIGEAGDLVHWTLGRLKSLSWQPGGDVFTQEVGSLLEELRLRVCPWNAAAVRLLGDPYVFMATGPRSHENWAHDVLAVLHRSVRDPRGWVRLDPDRTNSARDSVSAYPFDPPAASELADHLHPLERRAADTALAVMTEEWMGEPAPVRTRPDQDAVLTDARTLLDRYGPDARNWTNARAAASGPTLDFVTAGLRGTESHHFLTGEYINGLDLLEDLGVIAVSHDEVGVFWSIGAY